MTFGPITVVRPGANRVIAAMGSRGVQGNPGKDGVDGKIGPAPFGPSQAWTSGKTFLSGPPADYVAAPAGSAWYGGSFICAVPHTSGVFDTDVANGLWYGVALRGGAGPAGTAGSTWYSGSGLPSSIVGVNGDYFFRTDTYDVLLKVSGAWAAIANLKGLAGNTVLNGTGGPAASVGANNDFYLDTAAFIMYGPKVNGAWPSSGTSLVGPSGPGTGDVKSPGSGTVKPGQEVVFGADNQHIVGAVRTPRGDAAYSIQATDSTVAITAVLSAPRVFTLPAASAVAGGAQILIEDEVGGISATNTLTVSRAGTDLINGATSATIATGYGYLTLASDGVSRWTVVDSTATAPAIGALASANALAEIAALGPLAQAVARQNIGTLSRGRALALAMTN